MSNLLLFGELPEGASIEPFASATDDVAEQVDAVAILTPPPDISVLEDILDTIGRPLAPVADFTGSTGFRRDFTASAPTVASIAEILPGLCDLVDAPRAGSPLPPGSDRDGLRALGIAYSRKTPVRLAWTPEYPETLWYPALGSALSSRRLLENLAETGLMARRFRYRLHLCEGCQSHRLHAFESCGECGSGFLEEESVIHHFPCGEQAPESAFLSDHDLICPKCTRELRHFGIDYARPGQIVLCRSCHAVMSEPGVSFVCMDCNKISPAEHLETRDWFDYEITEEGVEAFLRLRLPATTFDALLEPHDRAYGRREFCLLAMATVRMAERYKRPMTMVRLTFPDIHEIRSKMGSVEAIDTIHLIVDLLEEQLRDTDYLTNSAENEILAILPETETEQARAALSRFSDRVAAVVKEPVDLQFSFLDADQALAAIEQLT